MIDQINSETTIRREKESNLQRLVDLADTIPKASITIYRESIANEAQIHHIPRDTQPTACVHAASLVDDRRSVDHPTDYLISNIIGTQKLLHAIVNKRSVKNFV